MTPHSPVDRLSVLALALLLLAGCPKPEARSPVGEPVETNSGRAAVALRVTVVDDAHLAETIEREWRAYSEEEIAIKPMSQEELLLAKRLNTDVLVVPAEILGDLVEGGRVSPLPDAALTDREISRDELFPHLRTELIVWGRRTYGLPLGAPTFQLLYRSDIFEKLELTPPKTWEEYQSLLPKLADRDSLGDLAPPQAAEWDASAEPLAKGWAGKLFLARAAAYAAERLPGSPLLDLNTLTPRTSEAPFEKALETLAAAAQDRTRWRQMTPDDARAELLSGRCAMAITWPSGIRGESSGEEAKRSPLKIAALPGAREFYSPAKKEWQPREAGETHVPFTGAAGAIACVASDCRRPSVAFKFVAWVAGPESAARISPQCAAGSPTRETQAALAERWIDGGLSESLANDYFGRLKADQSQGLHLPALRLPGHRELLQALDQAVEEVLDGKQSAATALEAAGATWKQSWIDKDAEAVRAAVRRSLNLGQ